MDISKVELDNPLTRKRGKSCRAKMLLMLLCFYEKTPVSEALSGDLHFQKLNEYGLHPNIARRGRPNRQPPVEILAARRHPNTGGAPGRSQPQIRIRPSFKLIGTPIPFNVMTISSWRASGWISSHSIVSQGRG